MIIVAGGDSFIFGSELADSPHGGLTGYSKQTFPALLAKDSEYICTAYPGNSNTEIANSILFYMVHNTSTLKDFAVIVCWTWPTRDSVEESSKMIQRLQDTLEDNEILYLFTCADNCIVEYLDKNTNWDNWYMFPSATEAWNTQEPRGFYQWAVESNYPCGLEQHPLEQAHLDAAKLMQGKFNEMVTKHLQQN